MASYQEALDWLVVHHDPRAEAIKAVTVFVLVGHLFGKKPDDVLRDWEQARSNPTRNRGA
jgi:hypothetical protein